MSFTLRQPARPNSTASAPQEPASEELPVYRNQWEYLDDWFTLVSGAIDTWLAPDTRADKPRPVESLQRRTAASCRAGVSLPFEFFVQKHRLDHIDRVLLLTLLYDALNPSSPGGVPLGVLFAACGASALTPQAEIRNRLEKCSALRTLELLECDVDTVESKRFYRLARWCKEVFLPLPDDAVEGSASEVDLIDRFDEAISRLFRRVSCNFDPDVALWCGPIPNGPGWSRYRAQARAAKRAVDDLRAFGTGPLAQTFNGLGFSRKEEAVLAVLLYDARHSITGLTVGFVLSFVEKYAGARTTWEWLTAEGSTLATNGLIKVSGDGPLSLRRVRLTEEAFLRLLPGTSFAQADSGTKDEEDLKAYERVEPKVKLVQAILTPEVKDELTELLFDIRSGRSFGEECGMPSPSHVGDGTVLLFEGPPGTGKTFTAEAVAHSLGRPVFRARFDQLLSKWVGQTEKAITGLFRDAEAEGAVVVIDEADAFLGARDRASQSFEISHINVLLQELERFQGLAILTTNRADSLDPALERRLAAHLTFKRPGPTERASMWRWSMPSKAPVSKEIDFNALARKWDFTGSQIRTATLRAARAAYRRQGADKVLTQKDLETAAKHVSQGKTPVPLGFRPAAPPLKHTDRRPAAIPGPKEVSR